MVFCYNTSIAMHAYVHIMYVILCSVCVAITVRLDQSTYDVTENNGTVQLFLVLSSPSSFNETVRLIDTDIDTDNSSANGKIIARKYLMCKYNLFYYLRRRY